MEQTILIIDDEESIRFTFSAFLSASGFRGDDSGHVCSPPWNPYPPMIRI